MTLSEVFHTHYNNINARFMGGLGWSSKTNNKVCEFSERVEKAVP